MTTDQVRGRLNDAKGYWPEICEDTGIKYHTLQKFASGSTYALRSDSMKALEQHRYIKKTPPKKG